MSDTPTPGRGPGRRFKKGESGNPGGRPRLPAELRGEALAKAQALLPKAFERIEKLMASRAPTVALAACQVVFDRALGKPETTAALTGADGKPLFNPQERDRSDIEVAREIAFVLAKGMKAMDETPEAPEITHPNTGDTTQ